MTLAFKRIIKSCNGIWWLKSADKAPKRYQFRTSVGTGMAGFCNQRGSLSSRGCGHSRRFTRNRGRNCCSPNGRLHLYRQTRSFSNGKHRSIDHLCNRAFQNNHSTQHHLGGEPRYPRGRYIRDILAIRGSISSGTYVLTIRNI